MTATYRHGMKPTYRHDCPKCRFLGATWKQCAERDDGGLVVDWYACEGQDRSVVGRSSSDGPDYWSMPESMVLAAGSLEPSVDPRTGDRAVDPMRLIALSMLVGGRV